MADYDVNNDNPPTFDPQNPDPNNPQQPPVPDNTQSQQEGTLLRDLRLNAPSTDPNDPQPQPQPQPQGGNNIAQAAGPLASQHPDNDKKIEAILDGRKDTSSTDHGMDFPVDAAPHFAPVKGSTASSTDKPGGNSAVKALTPDEQQQKALNRPAAAADYLAENWDKWHLGDNANFADLARNPPADLPQEAKDMIQYVNDHPALKNALDVGAANSAGPDGPKGYGTPDGVTTKSDVIRFADNARLDQAAGAKAFEAWQAANKDAGPVATEMARSAAILIANQTLLQNADPKAPSDSRGVVSKDALEAVAKGGYGALSDAARLFSQPGMFDQLDRAGISGALNSRDNLYDVNNVKSWLGSDALKTPAKAMAMFDAAASQAAYQSLRGDTSGVKADMFKVDEKGEVTLDTTRNYTPAQRAAVLVDLEETRAKLGAGAQESLWDGKRAEENGLNPSAGKVAADIDKRIAALLQDPDTAKAIGAARDAAYKSLADANPALKAQLQATYDSEVLNGGGLTKAANGEDVARFVQQAETMSKMLGQPEPDLNAVLNKPGMEATKKKLQDTYINDYVSGNRIDQVMAANPKMTVQEAAARVAAETAAMTSIMDPKVREDNAATLEANFSQHINSALLSHTTGTDVKAITDQFTKADGTLDEAKMEAALKQAQDASPDLFKGPDGKSQIPDMVKGLASVWGEARSGAKLTDALEKIDKKQFPNNNPFKPMYDKGAMHGIAVVLGGFALAARAPGAKTPSDIASLVGNGIALMGTTTEAFAKNAGSNVSGKDTDAVNAKTGFKKIENFGKVVGGIGNIISGFTGFMDGVGKPSTASGAVSMTGGLLSTASGFVSVFEGIASTTAANAAAAASALGTTSETAAAAFSAGLGTEEAAAAAATAAELGGAAASSAEAAAAGLSAASGALGVVAGAFAIGVTIWQIVTLQQQIDQHKQDINTYWTDIQPQLNHYGITGGPVDESDRPHAKPMPVWQQQQGQAIPGSSPGVF